MKFQKTLVAVAIAGIAAVPVVASADTTISGIIEMQVSGNDQDLDDGLSDPTVTAGDVLLGLQAEQELNNGLTGYGSLRLDLDSLSNANSEAVVSTPEGLETDNSVSFGGPSNDNIYTGIKGGFGDVRIGEVPLAVEVGQVANDIFDVGDEISGGLSYVGAFGPVGLTANYSPENNQDAAGVGASFSLAGFNIGVGFESRGIAADGDENEALAVGGSFALAGASIGVHYWTRDLRDGVEDAEGFAIKADYGFLGATASITFATLEGDTATGDVDANDIRLDLIYDLGGGTEISTRIDFITVDDDAGGGFTIEGSNEDQVRYRVQLAKLF